MKKAETPNALAANQKPTAEPAMLGSIFTSDANETDAIARKTAKTAVNRLNMLLPACPKPAETLRKTDTDAFGCRFGEISD